MLNCAETDFSDVEDISGGELMPNGTVALFTLKEVGAVRPNSNNKKFFTVTYEVAEGPYTGKEIKENYYLEGKDFALQKTKIMVRYVLESSIEAHKKGRDSYKIASYKSLETGKVVAKVKVKGFYGDSGDWIYTNEIDVLATPREDSSTYKIYQAYKNGEQPWQNDFKPSPAVKAASTASGYGTPVASQDGPPADAYGY